MTWASAVSELLKALSQQQEKWDRRFCAISRLADTSRRIIAPSPGAPTIQSPQTTLSPVDAK
jgi:hypothetical protein